ncbi:MAG: TPM domain-containing protein [Verrucomicrobiota bacterium]|nr:TPM domain-containing protein [Verrucomicrobiota bacterium]
MTGLRVRLVAYGIIASAFIGSALCAAAETIPPKPPKYFNDEAGIVSPGVASRLNEQLAQFERDTSDQVVVAIYKKMESDSDIADYTQRVAHAWGVGQKATRNGAVLFVYVDNHKMFIQVGYGLEGALPDITAFDITERHIKPHFKTGDYEGGIVTGVDLIEKAIRGEYKGTGSTVAEHSQHDSGGTTPLFVFLIMLILFFFMVRAARRNGGYRYNGLGGPFIASGWGGGGGGGWSGGGGGFSGFSGGGGGFGGGGAGSSW